MTSRKTIVRLLRVTLTVVAMLAPLAVEAQPQKLTIDQFVGDYKGTAKMTSGETEVTLQLKSASGKASGRAVAGGTEYQISSAEIVDGKLAIKFGSGPDAASLTLQSKGDKLAGDWVKGAQKGTVELTKVPPVVSIDLTGEWEAAADVQGQAFPFTLTLKVDGDKVTGSSNSQLGTSTISQGSWKDGKLAVILDATNGQIALYATVVDGKLSGDFDYAGQLSGKWIAAKKK